jgi:maltoporin
LSAQETGFLTQQFTYQQHEYRLTNEGLWVRIIRQAASYLGDRGASTGGPGNVEVLEGILTRMD